MTDKPWFVLRRKPGGFTGAPSSGAGWLALLLVILVPTALSLLLSPPAFAVHPALGVLAIVAPLAISLFVFFRIVLKKGRWIE